MNGRNLFHGMPRRTDWHERETELNRTDYIVAFAFLLLFVISGVIRGI